MTRRTVYLVACIVDFVVLPAIVVRRAWRAADTAYADYYARMGRDDD